MAKLSERETNGVIESCEHWFLEEFKLFYDF